MCNLAWKKCHVLSHHFKENDLNFSHDWPHINTGLLTEVISRSVRQEGERSRCFPGAVRVKCGLRERPASGPKSKVTVSVSVRNLNKLEARLNKYPALPFYPDPSSRGSEVKRSDQQTPSSFRHSVQSSVSSVSRFGSRKSWSDRSPASLF